MCLLNINTPKSPIPNWKKVAELNKKYNTTAACWILQETKCKIHGSIVKYESIKIGHIMNRNYHL